MSLGLLGIDILEPLPAGGADKVTQLGWLTGLGHACHVSLELNGESLKEIRLQERAIMFTVVKYPEQQLDILGIILAPCGL